MSKLPVHVALVSESAKVSAPELAEVAAALQAQVHRDFAPVWFNVDAVVAAFPTRKTVPLGYWPIIVQDHLDDPGALGYHTDDHRQPMAYVEATPDWTVTASHELLEMLADPFGNRMYVAHSPAPGVIGQVRILVEVCDPCEAFTYQISGVEVSDFATPAWYHTVHRMGSHYDLVGKLTEPRVIEAGGYVSFVEPDGRWWQMTWFGGSVPIKRLLGRLEDFARPGDSLRQAVDRATRTARMQA